MITYLRICKSSRNKLITVFWKFFFTVKTSSYRFRRHVVYNSSMHSNFSRFTSTFKDKSRRKC